MASEKKQFNQIWGTAIMKSQETDMCKSFSFLQAQFC